MSENIAAEVAAILEEFRTNERAAALMEAKRARITFTKSLSPGCQMGSEFVVDQNCEKGEIDTFLDLSMWAADRQEATIELVHHLRQLRSDQALLRQQMKDRASQEIRYSAENEQIARDRRNPVRMSKQQQAALETMKKGIEDTGRSIDERRWSIDECERIIAGSTRLDAMRETLRLREEAERGKAAA